MRVMFEAIGYEWREIYCMHSLINRGRFWLGLLVILLIGGPVSADDEPRWTGSWYSPPMKAAPTFSNATVRTVVRLTVGGDRLRLRFSNVYGHTPLKIGVVHVTVGMGSQDVLFKERSQVTLPAGMSTVSDAVSLKTAAGQEVVISVFYPEAIPLEITQDR